MRSPCLSVLRAGLIWARFPSADSNHRCILRRDPLIWDGPAEKMSTNKSGYFVAHQFVQQISLVHAWLVEKMTSHATGPSSIVTRPQEHGGWWRTVNCRDSEAKNTRFLSTHGKTDRWDRASWSWTTFPLKHKGVADLDRSPSLRTVKGDFHQGNVSLFGNNSVKQCVAMSLTAIVHNTAVQSCYAWRSVDINYILRTGDSLYTVIHGLIGKDYLLLTDVPANMFVHKWKYIYTAIQWLHFWWSSHVRSSGLLFTTELPSMSLDYEIKCSSCILWQWWEFKYFDSHCRDVYGNVHGNGTSVLLAERSLHGTLNS